MMGGEIMAQSELGQGSTFTVRLPAEVPLADEPRAVAGVLHRFREREYGGRLDLRVLGVHIVDCVAERMRVPWPAASSIWRSPGAVLRMIQMLWRIFSSPETSAGGPVFAGTWIDNGRAPS